MSTLGSISAHASIKSLGGSSFWEKQVHLQLHMAEGCAELLHLDIASNGELLLQPDQSLLLRINVCCQSLQCKAEASAMALARGPPSSTAVSLERQDEAHRSMRYIMPT